MIFARKYRIWSPEDWSGVLWSDEARFCTSDSSCCKVWRRPGSDPLDPRLTQKVVKHPPSLMVWECFSYGGTGKLVILPKGQTVNAERYIEILKENLGPSFEKTGAWMLQQDGAPCHTAKAVKDWFSEQEIQVISD